MAHEAKNDNITSHHIILSFPRNLRLLIKNSFFFMSKVYLFPLINSEVRVRAKHTESYSLEYLTLSLLISTFDGT